MTDNSAYMTLVVDKKYDSRNFYFRTYESKDELPKDFMFHRGEYLYAYEMNDHVEFGHTEARNLKGQTSWATRKVAILGPIRDIDHVVEEIKNTIDEWDQGDTGSRYMFESLEEFTGNPFNRDFKGRGIFQIIQSNYRNGFKGMNKTLHSLDGGHIVRDLIIPAQGARLNVVVFETIDGVEHGEENTFTV